MILQGRTLHHWVDLLIGYGCDDHSRYKYSGFMKKKSDISNFAENVFKKVQVAGHTIKYICCGTFKMLVIKRRAYLWNILPRTLRNRMEWLSERSRTVGTWVMQ